MSGHILKEVWRGKSLHRILFEREVAKGVRNLKGVIVDLASGPYPGYSRLCQGSASMVVRVDINGKNKPDVIADLNKPLPFKTESIDSIFFFNSFHILEEPEEALAEIYRVLKKGGTLYLSSPFVFAETPQPHDYHRFTYEKLEKMLEQAHLTKVAIERYGGRFSSAVFLLSPYLPKLLRVPSAAISLFLDKKLAVKTYLCPLGFFGIARK